MSTKKANTLEEIVHDKLTEGQKTYDAMVNSKFLEIEALEKKVSIKVPNNSEQAGYKKVTLTIIYDEKGEGASIKMNARTKFEPADVKYINDNYDKILKY